jgi:hypothetical protein
MVRESEQSYGGPLRGFASIAWFDGHSRLGYHAAGRLAGA